MLLIMSGRGFCRAFLDPKQFANFFATLYKIALLSGFNAWDIFDISHKIGYDPTVFIR